MLIYCTITEVSIIGVRVIANVCQIDTGIYNGRWSKLDINTVECQLSGLKVKCLSVRTNVQGLNYACEIVDVHC